MTHPAVRVVAEGRPGQIGLFTWLHLTLEEGLPDVESSDWDTETGDLEAMVLEADEVLVHDRWIGGQNVLARLGGCLIHLALFQPTRNVRSLVAGPDRKATSVVAERIRELVPERALDEAVQRIGFTAWHHREEGGAVSRTREVDVPTWGQIGENYAVSTRKALTRLFEDFEPGQGG